MGLVAILEMAASSPAAALPLCFKWQVFCDGIQVNHNGRGGAEWYHWDCANNSPMDVKTSVPPGFPPPPPCSIPNPVDFSVVRSLAPNGPGDYFFVIDKPLDGDLNMYQGVYANGSCWIPGLQYNLQMGNCAGLDGGGNVSSVMGAR